MVKCRQYIITSTVNYSTYLHQVTSVFISSLLSFCTNRETCKERCH